MSEKVDIAYKFGAGRYIQGDGVLDTCGDQIALFGRKAYVIGGPKALSIVGDRLKKALSARQIDVVFREYSGHCCYETAHEMIDELHAQHCDVILGAGGGRIMDLTKLTGDLAGIPFITIPTTCATCAAFSSLSVVYTPEGKPVGNFYLTHEASAVIADTGILCQQPLRYAVAGIYDALSKYIEIKNGSPSMAEQEVRADLMSAYALCLYTYRFLTENLESICEAIEKKENSRLIEDFTFVTIAATGIISGLSKGFGQSAIAHEFYYRLRNEYTQASWKYTHGELVALGLLPQLVYNQTPEEVGPFAAVMKKHGAPVCMSDIGIVPTSEVFETLYRLLCASSFVKEDEACRRRLKDGLELIMK